MRQVIKAICHGVLVVPLLHVNKQLPGTGLSVAARQRVNNEPEQVAQGVTGAGCMELQGRQGQFSFLSWPAMAGHGNTKNSDCQTPDSGKSPSPDHWQRPGPLRATSLF